MSTETISRTEYERRNAKILVLIEKANGDLGKLTLKLANLEEKIEERAKSLSIALDKASSTMNQRLETMNEFRSQINQERSSYVTLDKIDLMLKTVRVEIDGVRSQLIPVKDRQEFTRGRDSTIYAIIASGIAALAVIIELVKSILGH